jgi:Protein of unknown function (DUF2281)
LPEPQQAEVLDFVEFLAAKHTNSTEGRAADREWMEASLAQALRGLQDEPEDYSLADLEERFS